MNRSPVFTSVKNSMQWLVKRNKSICFTLLSSTVLLSVNAHAELRNLADMHKQLDIMNNIIQSAIKSVPKESRSKISSTNSFYLQGQGAVFTLNSGRYSSFDLPTVMPIAPIAPMSPGANFSFNGQDVIGDVVIDFESDEQEYEQAIEIFEQQREHSRDLRNEQRELAYELRDIERERKDAQYQLRHVEEKEKKALKAELKKLQSKRSAIEKNKITLEKKAKLIQVKQAEQQALKAEQRNNYFEKISSTVVDTLCMYGNGLKAVPKNENVSLIIKTAGEKVENRYQDLIYVFSKKDINACANDKIDSKKLLANAHNYSF